MAQEIIYVPGETYTSVRATPELVGRKDVLEQIDRAIRDTSQSYIIYITGQGGIGKTRLVRHVLQHSPGDSLAVAADLVDLYHTSNQTPEGLADAIQRALSSDGGPFENYLAARDRFNEHLTRYGSAPEAQRRQMLAAFMGDLNELAEHKRILLSLDTAEKLFFQKDLAAERLGLAEEHPAVLEWLLSEFLPHIRNAVILLSGRREETGLGQSLDQALSGIPGKCMLPIDLPGLTESEALEYFEAVVESSRTSGEPGDIEVAEAVERWSDEDRQAIFYCLRDEGDPPTVRPILLALAIDYLVIAGRPVPALSRSPAEARGLTAGEREGVRNELGEALVQMLHERRRPADEVIRALGWLRKGADAELLAHITELEKAEVERTLEDIRDLSFVKVRPADNRVFLHDEMYALLERFALERISDAERDRVFGALRRYYDERIEQARREIAELYRPLAEQALPDPACVAAARARLLDALIEDLHYRLRWDAVQGFQTYFRYAEEAIAAGDTSLDVQLRAELLGFLSARDPSGIAEEIDGLRRADVVADTAVRWIKRMIGDGENKQALELAQRLRSDAKSLIEGGGDLVAAELDIWEGLAHIYAGENEVAQQLLTGAIEKLVALSVPQEQLVRWSAILARAYNNLGYLQRVQGQFVAAADAYQRALPHWRYVKIEAEQANTLTNLAYALALRGQFDGACRCAVDALALRERLGPRGPVALTCNTMAEIETHAGHYREAELYAWRALNISRALEFKRGEGLALLSLTALRRFLSEAPDFSSEEKRDILTKTLDGAQEAVEIFSALEEPERRIRAFYERGITFRELGRVSEAKETREAYFRDAETDLNRARKLASQEGLPLAYLDASLGLAWTYYHAGEKDKVEQILQEVKRELEEHFSVYRIVGSRFPEVREDTMMGVFNQVARLHVLQGVMAMDDYEESDKQPPYKDLRKAAHEFTLALEYSVILAHDHQGLRRAVNTIYNRVKELNIRELKALYEGITEVAGNLGKAPQECHLWHKLENHFGPYEILNRLAV